MDDKKAKTKDCDYTKKDKVKREDGITTGSHARDTAGGGRGTFSNAYGDVPMSILQKEAHGKHTPHPRQLPQPKRPQPQQCKRKGRSSSKKETRNNSSSNKEKMKEDYSEMSFDIIRKNARCLNNGGRFDELLKELEGCKWDAVLLSETWMQEKREIWESTFGHIYMGAGGFTLKHGGVVLLN